VLEVVHNSQGTMRSKEVMVKKSLIPMLIKHVNELKVKKDSEGLFENIYWDFGADSMKIFGTNRNVNDLTETIRSFLNDL
jgi:hypothetical protein